VYDIAKIPCVQKAWIQGKELRIHGLVYQMENGVFKDLGLTLNKLEMLP
jgi:carbonic anhydrase